MKYIDYYLKNVANENERLAYVNDMPELLDRPSECGIWGDGRWLDAEILWVKHVYIMADIYALRKGRKTSEEAKLTVLAILAELKEPGSTPVSEMIQKQYFFLFRHIFNRPFNQ